MNSNMYSDSITRAVLQNEDRAWCSRSGLQGPADNLLTGAECPVIQQMKSALALECRTTRGSEHYIWQLSKDKCKAGGCSLQVVNMDMSQPEDMSTLALDSVGSTASLQQVEFFNSSECQTFSSFGRPFLAAMWCGARWTCRLWILRYRAQLQMQLTCQGSVILRAAGALLSRFLLNGKEIHRGCMNSTSAMYHHDVSSYHSLSSLSRRRCPDTASFGSGMWSR